MPARQLLGEGNHRDTRQSQICTWEHMCDTAACQNRSIHLFKTKETLSEIGFLFIAERKGTLRNAVFFQLAECTMQLEEAWLSKTNFSRGDRERGTKNGMVARSQRLTASFLNIAIFPSLYVLSWSSPLFRWSRTPLTAGFSLCLSRKLCSQKLHAIESKFVHGMRAVCLGWHAPGKSQLPSTRQLLMDLAR